MIRNSDIENFDKKMPFNDTPADFFDTFPEKVLQRIQKRKQRQALVRRISTVAAAAVVGIAITLTLVGNDPAITSSSSPDKTAMRYADIDSYISKMSDEELDALLQMYEADVMMQMEE